MEESVDAESADETSIPAGEPSGPVAHIRLDPASRTKKKPKNDSPGPAKLALCGGLGLLVLLIAGYFVSTTVFGLDLRPASRDTSVSKYMLEDPEVVARIDVEQLLNSRAFRHSPFNEQWRSHPAFSYAADVKDALLVMDGLQLEAPEFLMIVNLKRDYRSEFIANLIEDAETETIGAIEMHIDPDSLGEVATAACLPEPRTLLVGSPRKIREVIERDDYPKLYPRESELIAATAGGGKVATLGMFFDSLESMVSKAKADLDKQMKELGSEQRKMMKEMMGDVDSKMSDVQYSLKNIRYLKVDLELSDQLKITSHAECGSSRKAQKIAKIFDGLMAEAANSGVPGMDGISSTPLTARGSAIEGSTTIDLSEISDALTAGLPDPGF